MRDTKPKSIIYLITYTAVIFALLLRIEHVLSFFRYVLYAVQPLAIGTILALTLDCPACFLERRLFSKLSPKIRRRLSVVLSCLSIIGVITLLICFLLPDLVESVGQIISRLPQYIETVSNAFDRYSELLGIKKSSSGGFSGISEEMARQLTDSFSEVFATAFDFSKRLMRSLLAVVFSVYLLFYKNDIIRLIDRMSAAFFSKKRAQSIKNYVYLIASTFKKFISGQMLEAVILGALCFIGMLIIKLPYAPVISILIGVTSVVPVLGAYIGAIPAVFLLLLESPVQAVIFVVFLVALQQFEGAVIYPKVVGDAIGIDGLFVFAGITLGAGFGGVSGVIIGVPLVAVAYAVFSNIVAEREKKRRRTEKEE